MATNNTENMRFRVSVGNDEKEVCKLRIMTLERVNKIIDSRKIEPRIAYQLKQMAARYPQQALENFVMNLDHHLHKARQASKNGTPTLSPQPELGDEPSVVTETQGIENAPQTDEFN